eukprot:jgi/Undpi1/5738/HiC_scaffold_2.g01012.m1
MVSIFVGVVSAGMIMSCLTLAGKAGALLATAVLAVFCVSNIAVSTISLPSTHSWGGGGISGGGDNGGYMRDSAGASRQPDTLAGAWQLDLSRSDTMEAYLRCMHASEQVINASVEGEKTCASRNAIALDGSTLVIYKQTVANNFTETFKLGVKKTTEGMSGTKRSTASLTIPGRLDGLVTVSSVPTANSSEVHLVERRWLEPGGNYQTQELTLSNLTTGETCTTWRSWERVPMTLEERQQLAM